jgi:putative membrane protein
MNEPKDSPVDPRIYMAAERTFLAWIRTGIAFMGFGFVVARFGLFLRELASAPDVKVTLPANGFSLPAGIALIVAGIIVILGATLRHARYVRVLNRGQINQPHGLGFGFLVAGALTVIGVAVAVYLAFFV